MEKGLVKEVELSNSGKVKIILTNGKVAMTDNPRTENFKEELLLYNIKVVEKEGTLNQAIPMTLLVLLIGIMTFYLNRNMSKQAEKEMSNMSKMDTVEFF